ncbi:unnamed protein product [Schistosoma curassoni]|uniref:Uncharacterized protein n=1 Tax=Schistosoma curassoni TaxID=6186 RepID=A0A183KQ85_9TREM|nr:unnamed protein product [Schistosoma curassoni]
MFINVLYHLLLPIPQLGMTFVKYCLQLFTIDICKP